MRISASALLSFTTTATAAVTLLAPTPGSSFAFTFPSNRVAFGTRSIWQLSSAPEPTEGGGESPKESFADVGINEMHTLMVKTVEDQDFVKAGVILDEMFKRLNQDIDVSALSEKEINLRKSRMSWSGLGAPEWLVDRLNNLGYKFPTTIQMNSMNAVNEILYPEGEREAFKSRMRAELASVFDPDAEKVELNQADEDINIDNNMIQQDLGVVISGNTGAGKTLAFLVPLVGVLGEVLFDREALRVGAEKEVGGSISNILDRMSVVTSPALQSSDNKATRDTLAEIGRSMASLGSDQDDVKSPLALIVAPTRELGMQISNIMYELVGGNIKKDPTKLVGKANSFNYKGPKGVQIARVLDEDEADFGLKLQTDIVVTSPKYLTRLLTQGDIDTSKLRVIAFDEADLTLEQMEPEDLKLLFSSEKRDKASDDGIIDAEGTEANFVRDYLMQPKPENNRRLTFLVGASVTEALGELAIQSKVLPIGKSYIATSMSYSPLRVDDEKDADEVTPEQLAGDRKEASLQDLDVCLDPGLRHERVRMGNSVSGLMVLARLLRKELKDFDERAAGDDNAPKPRVVVFFPDEVSAKAAIEPLRDSMWGEHLLCVLLPETGVDPIGRLDDFKSGKTSVMLATANSVRGLDCPDVTHVYTLYLPTDDPREYIHLAGRVGRVGQMGSARGYGGRVVSIVDEADASNMDELADELGFEFIDTKLEASDVPRNDDGEIDLDKVDVEAYRQLLQDTLNFVPLAEDVEIDPEAVKQREALRAEMDDEDEDDEDWEDDEDEDEETKDDDEPNIDPKADDDNSQGQDDK